MQSIVSGNTGAQMGGWFRKEITSMADVKGLNMRTPGLGGRLWQAVGAVPRQIPGGDVEHYACVRGAVIANDRQPPRSQRRS